MKESMLPLDTGVEYVVAENLRLNFPRHEIAIPFTEAGTKLGSNFREIAKKVNGMHDTFGLCGVLAVTVNGLLANPNAWQDVNFDPVELKTKFDNWSKNHTGDSAWMWFDKTHKKRFTKGPNDFTVLTETQLQQITPRLDENKIKRVVFDVALWQDALHLQEENRLKPPDEKLDFVGVASPDLSRIFDQLADNKLVPQ